MGDNPALGEASATTDGWDSSATRSFDALPTALLLADRSGRVLYANPRAERILGRGTAATVRVPVQRTARGTPAGRSSAGSR